MKTYNGWTNYATWGIALVLDNDEGTYNAVHERVAELREDTVVPEHVASITTRDEYIAYQLEDWLKDFTEELCGLGGDAEDYGIPEPSMMARQVIAAGLSDVDWPEIANHYLSE